MHVINLVGQRFGRLVVLARVANQPNGKCVYRCRCDCGLDKTTAGEYLRAGRVKSCGCYRRDAGKRFTTHGQRRTGEWRSWSAAKNRCANPKNAAYRYYGALGVSMCPRWAESFAAFLADMGPRPSPVHSLDRWPDNHGNYEPGNCRWATATEQSRNRRRTKGWRLAKDAAVRMVLDAGDA